jgi:hypothetical protein
MSHYANKQAASRAANALAKRLGEKMGGKWTPMVTENMGFHARAVLGAVCVFVTPYGEGPSYSVLVSDTSRFPGTGNPEWSLGEKTNRFDRPEDAARAGMANAFAYVNEMLGWMFDSTVAKMKKQSAATTAAVLQIEIREMVQDLKKK